MLMCWCTCTKAEQIGGLNYSLNPEKHTAMVNRYNRWDGDLEIPSHVTYEDSVYTVIAIEGSAFSGCNTLTRVRIPSTVMAIGERDYKNPFAECINLEAIEVDSCNEWMCSVDGVLFNRDTTQLWCYPAGAKQEKYVFPESVTWIGGSAFCGNSYLKELRLPDRINHISSCAFYRCENIESLTLPSGLTYISASMCREMPSLRSVTIPSSVKGMGEYAFGWCTSLESIVLPEGLNSLVGETFYSCTSLKSVELPSTCSVTEAMFYKCSALTDVKISNGVKVISSSAFAHCTSLRILDIPASVSYMGYYLFTGCKLDAIVIRGTLELSKPSRLIFKDLDTSTPIYTLPSQVSAIKEIYAGPVYSLDKYNEHSNIPQTAKADINQGSFYDLNGRKVDVPQEGIYIIKGKKVILK